MLADPLTFKVNGVEIPTDHESLSANDILKLAREKGAIPRDPEGYILQGDKGRYEGNDIVNLKEDNILIAGFQIHPRA